MKIKKGDTVLIIAGKDKGKKGNVLKSLPQDSKVLVEGVNLVKKHQKPRKQGEKGQIIQKPAPLNVSNVKLICSHCGKPARVGYIVLKDNKKRETKSRICKKCNQEI